MKWCENRLKPLFLPDDGVFGIRSVGEDFLWKPALALVALCSIL
ncbi:conserved hypothetical protein [delta proteobacterium NaphS2]|nr:conserved hypothetical protein [delta proteobacterium NaphS2]